MHKSFFSFPSEASSSSSLSVAVHALQIHIACLNMQPNIWLMPLLRDAGGWGQQTANPALLTSGREQIEKEGKERKEGRNMMKNMRRVEDKTAEAERDRGIVEEVTE